MPPPEESTWPPSIQWVVFDYGEVISRRSTAFPQLATLLGVELSALRDAYRRERDAYVLGATDATYWRAVADRLGVRLDHDLARQLTALDIQGWLEVDPAAVELVTALHTSGVPLALLSNLPSSLARAMEAQPWTRWFQHLLFSADLGVAKPAPGSWQALVDRLATPPGACLMFDDRQYNVDAARLASLQAVRWEGADPARQLLGRLGLLPDRHLQR